MLVERVWFFFAIGFSEYEFRKLNGENTECTSGSISLLHW